MGKTPTCGNLWMHLFNKINELGIETTLSIHPQVALPVVTLSDSVKTRLRPPTAPHQKILQLHQNASFFSPSHCPAAPVLARFCSGHKFESKEVHLAGRRGVGATARRASLPLALNTHWYV